MSISLPYSNLFNLKLIWFIICRIKVSYLGDAIWGSGGNITSIYLSFKMMRNYLNLQVSKLIWVKFKFIQPNPLDVQSIYAKIVLWMKSVF